MVFGCEPSLIGQSLARYQTGIAALHEKSDWICFSGIGTAQEMAKRFLAKQPSYYNFMVENCSRSTYQNIRFSLPRFAKWDQIILCSSWYHLPRIMIIYWLTRRRFWPHTRIKPLPTWTFSPRVILDTILEPFKLIVDLASIFCPPIYRIHKKLVIIREKYL